MGLETVEILMDLEDFFAISIPDSLASACVTVADLQAVIVKILAERGTRDCDETRQMVWDGMMSVLEENGIDVRQVHPDSKWIGDITQYG